MCLLRCYSAGIKQKRVAVIDKLRRPLNGRYKIALPKLRTRESLATPPHSRPECGAGAVAALTGGGAPPRLTPGRRSPEKIARYSQLVRNNVLRIGAHCEAVFFS